jgi:hypothetical protein
VTNFKGSSRKEIKLVNSEITFLKKDRRSDVSNAEELVAFAECMAPALGGSLRHFRTTYDVRSHPAVSVAPVTPQ